MSVSEEVRAAGPGAYTQASGSPEEAETSSGIPQPILTARGIRREFSGFVAVDDVNLDVAEGSIHALIGPNGAGKTTCFQLLSGFLVPTRGRILYAGEDITGLAPAEIARRGVVRSFQISAVFPKLTALVNVRMALQRKRGNSYDFWRSDRSLSVYNQQALHLLESVGIADFANKLAAELPYGRKRALELATTLALNPRVLLLDEPTAGMAHQDVSRIVELIARIRVGRTILMVEHNLTVVSGLCDKITVLNRGRVLKEGDYQTVAQDPEVIAAYLGSEETDVDQ